MSLVVPTSYLFICSRHPSVSKDYGSVLCMEDLEQRLVLLRRPIRELQSLPHRRQIQSVLCPAPWFCFLCDFLFASACWTRVSSNWERPWCTACLQAERSDVRVSHLLRSIPKAFRSRLQTSLYRSCGLPLECSFPEHFLDYFSGHLSLLSGIHSPYLEKNSSLWW